MNRNLLPSLRWSAIGAALLVIGNVNLQACNIPVFRYALERWQPDDCEWLVFYQQPLSAADDQTLRDWESASTANDGHANLKVTRCLVGSDNLPAAARDAWQSVRQLPDLALPHVLVRTRVAGRWINHWHGSLAEAGKANLLNSPARRELNRRLLAGDSVVWFMLKSDDKQRAQQTAESLQRNFKLLSKTLSLPEGVGLPGSELHSEIPLLLKFSVLEIDAADPQEQYLVSLLKGFRPEAFQQGEPLLVPVFGRGRALEVIPASELDAQLMKDLTMFLSAACSCQVKEQNPGFDLLISADWDTLLFGADGFRPPPAKTVGDRVKSPRQLTIPPGR